MKKLLNMTEIINIHMMCARLLIDSLTMGGNVRVVVLHHARLALRVNQNLMLM